MPPPRLIGKTFFKLLAATALIVIMSSSSVILNAQQLGGIVVDPCAGSRVIPNAKVVIQFNSDPNQVWVVQTNSSGQWFFSFTAEHPNGSYNVSVVSPTAAEPTSGYTVTKPGSNNTQLNFSAFPDIPMRLQNCWNSSSIPLDGENTAYILNCDGNANIFQNWVFSIHAGEAGLLAPGGNCDIWSIAPYCITYKFWLSDQDKNRLGAAPISQQTFSYMDCRNLCLGFEGAIGFYLSQVKLRSAAGFYMVDFEINCCSERGPSKRVSQHVFINQNGISTSDAEFTYLASNTVEGINNEPQPYDGHIARSAVKPGPALGDLSVGLNIALPAQNYITSYTVSVYETTCSGFDNDNLIYEEINPVAPMGQLSYPYLFLTRILDAATQLPYFYVNSNTVGKCFKVKVSVTNACGSASTTGYFTITEQCQFCLIDNNPDLTQNSLRGITRETQNISSGSAIRLVNNPASGTAQFSVAMEQVGDVYIDLYSPSGQMLQRIAAMQGVEQGTHSINWVINTGTPSGLYLYKWKAGGESGAGKIIIH